MDDLIGQCFEVQFHPESILSEVGYPILANFLLLSGLAISQTLPTDDFASPEVRARFQSQMQREPDDIPLVVLPRGAANRT